MKIRIEYNVSRLQKRNTICIAQQARQKDFCKDAAALGRDDLHPLLASQLWNLRRRIPDRLPVQHLSPQRRWSRWTFIDQ